MMYNLDYDALEKRLNQEEDWLKRYPNLYSWKEKRLNRLREIAHRTPEPVPTEQMSLF